MDDPSARVYHKAGTDYSSPVLPGAVVYLHNHIHNKIIAMTDSDVETTPVQSSTTGDGWVVGDPIPAAMTWEVFRVSDAGDGYIRLFNEYHQQYIVMNSDGDINRSPNAGTWERFKVVKVYNADRYYFWQPDHQKAFRVWDNGNVDTQPDPATPDTLVDRDYERGWTWEMFTIGVQSPGTPYPTPPVPLPTPAPSYPTPAPTPPTPHPTPAPTFATTPELFTLFHNGGEAESGVSCGEASVPPARCAGLRKR
jgi:hypothetical protein